MNIANRLLLVTLMVTSMLTPPNSLTTSGTLTVRVESESGDPVSGVNIIIEKYDEATYDFSVAYRDVTDSSGLVTFANLPVTDNYDYSLSCMSEYDVIGDFRYYLIVTEDLVDVQEVDFEPKWGDPIFTSIGNEVTFQLVIPTPTPEPTPTPTPTTIKETVVTTQPTTVVTTVEETTSAETTESEQTETTDETTSRETTAKETTEPPTELTEPSEPPTEETESITEPTEPSSEVFESSATPSESPTSTTSAPEPEVPQTGLSHTWPIVGSVLLLCGLGLLLVKRSMVR